MLKRIWTSKSAAQRSAQKIASNYASYADYAQNASDSEKQKVILASLIAANKMQRDLVVGRK